MLGLANVKDLSEDDISSMEQYWKEEEERERKTFIYLIMLFLTLGDSFLEKLIEENYETAQKEIFDTVDKVDYQNLKIKLEKFFIEDFKDFGPYAEGIVQDTLKQAEILFNRISSGEISTEEALLEILNEEPVKEILEE